MIAPGSHGDEGPVEKILKDVRLTGREVTVCWAAIPSPYVVWNERQLGQGFAWRPGAVSFRTLEDDGPHDIRIYRVRGEPPLPPRAVRVIEVPFLLPVANGIEVGGRLDTRMLGWLAGSYLLRVAFFNAPRLEFAFMKDAEPRFAIPVADAAIARRTDFDLSGIPA